MINDEEWRCELHLLASGVQRSRQEMNNFAAEIHSNSPNLLKLRLSLRLICLELISLAYSPLLSGIRLLQVTQAISDSSFGHPFVVGCSQISSSSQRMAESYDLCDLFSLLTDSQRTKVALNFGLFGPIRFPSIYFVFHLMTFDFCRCSM